MVNVNISLEKSEYDILNKLKGDRTWKQFVTGMSGNVGVNAFNNIEKNKKELLEDVKKAIDKFYGTSLEQKGEADVKIGNVVYDRAIAIFEFIIENHWEDGWVGGFNEYLREFMNKKFGLVLSEHCVSKIGHFMQAGKGTEVDYFDFNGMLSQLEDMRDKGKDISEIKIDDNHKRQRFLELCGILGELG